jgi:type IV secretion system protein VirD4
MATIRSKKMAVEIFLQAFEQLNFIYGSDQSKAITQNCKPKITLSGVSDEAAKRFSDLCGKRDVENISITYSDKNSMSMSVSKQERPVVTPDEIRRMKSYELLIVTDNLRPVKDDKNYYYMTDLEFKVFKKSPFGKETNQRTVSFIRLLRELLTKLT